LCPLFLRRSAPSRAEFARLRSRSDEHEQRFGLNNKELQIEELITPTVGALDAAVWGVEYLNQGKYSLLRIYVERDEGVSVDLCAEVSRHVSDLLDVEEILPSAYTLEVSSPGMDRLLFKGEQYPAHVGERLDVRLNYPFEGRKKIVGTLAGLEDDSVVLQVDDEEYLLPLENVQKARIVPVFD
jgi:ribosome maturation factor RimP